MIVLDDLVFFFGSLMLLRCFYLLLLSLNFSSRRSIRRILSSRTAFKWFLLLVIGMSVVFGLLC